MEAGSGEWGGGLGRKTLTTLASATGSESWSHCPHNRCGNQDTEKVIQKKIYIYKERLTLRGHMASRYKAKPKPRQPILKPELTPWGPSPHTAPHQQCSSPLRLECLLESKSGLKVKPQPWVVIFDSSSFRHLPKLREIPLGVTNNPDRWACPHAPSGQSTLLFIQNPVKPRS